MDVHTVTGAAIEPYIDDLARLRIAVFREFPYLYDGTAGYEASYLRTYAEAESSFFALAIDEGRVVGVSTAVAMRDAEALFRDPFEAAMIPLDGVVYFGESVLLEPYRGRGLGHRFFDAREEHARRLGASITTFCAVDRPDDHPRRPAQYRTLDGFWQRRGYCRRSDLRVRYPWKDLDEVEETPKHLTFWLRHV